MRPLPPKIRKALEFTLHEYELAAAERWNADEFVAFIENCDEPGSPRTADDPHIDTLSRGMRDLLVAGHIEGALYVAIKLGEVLAEDEYENSIQASWRDRGQREAEAILKAASRRWGTPDERRKLDEEILAIAMDGVAAKNGKQALHEVARIINERHPSQHKQLAKFVGYSQATKIVPTGCSGQLRLAISPLRKPICGRRRDARALPESPRGC